MPDSSSSSSDLQIEQYSVITSCQIIFGDIKNLCGRLKFELGKPPSFSGLFSINRRNTKKHQQERK